MAGASLWLLRGYCPEPHAKTQSLLHGDDRRHHSCTSDPCRALAFVTRMKQCPVRYWLRESYAHYAHTAELGGVPINVGPPFPLYCPWQLS